MELRAGSRVKSVVCTTEAIIVKAPDGDVDITCGGVAMVDPADAPDEPTTPLDDGGEGSLLGKRYVDSDETIEALCTKAGAGSMGIGGAPLVLKEAKPLPASD